jgi:hypothetical protein
MKESVRNKKLVDEIRIHLESLNSPSGEVWTLTLLEDILTLSRPDGRMALQLHRDEAARYLRFTRDVLRGRILVFDLVQGAKVYSFRCSREQQAALLGWLPGATSAQRTRQIRLSCVGVALFGILHLLLPHGFLWPCGICLIASALIGLAFPRQFMFLLNGCLLFASGLWDLSAGSPLDLRPWAVSPDQRVAPVLVGCLVLLWGIQQLSMLSPNQWLRAVRAARDEKAAFLPEHSEAVRFVAFSNAIVSAFFGAYSLTLLIGVAMNGVGGSGSITASPMRELIVFVVLAQLTALSAVWLLARKTPAYGEAKVSGQFLVSVCVLVIWGFLSNGLHTGSSLFLKGFVTSAPSVFTKPYVWGSLILCVLVFNHCFGKAVDRELEEQRG